MELANVVLVLCGAAGYIALVLLLSLCHFDEEKNNGGWAFVRGCVSVTALAVLLSSCVGWQPVFGIMAFLGFVSYLLWVMNDRGAV